MTICGVVTPHRQAVIQLSILGSTERRTIAAIIDTGFNDFLALSSQLITELNLSFEARLTATMADGRTVETNSYRAKILWDGEPREVLAVACDGGPLVGMSLLYGYDLHVEAIDHGLVTIEKRQIT